MTKPSHTGNADLHELVSLYALGALDAREKEAFEEHLRQGCGACDKDLRSFTSVATAVGEAFPAAPPARIRERLLDNAVRMPQVPGILQQQGGLLIARSAEVAWQSMSPGIDYKTLYVDPARKYSTCLMRMAPGTRYPSHRHSDIEELFMLSGDLHVEGQIMRTGDYCRADAGSLHGETYSDTGCLVLVMSSLQNEMYAH
jgi:anti-sigma factor ChrR (cupin superfamily)